MQTYNINSSFTSVLVLLAMLTSSAVQSQTNTFPDDGNVNPGRPYKLDVYAADQQNVASFQLAADNGEDIPFSNRDVPGEDTAHLTIKNDGDIETKALQEEPPFHITGPVKIDGDTTFAGEVTIARVPAKGGIPMLGL